MVRLIAIAVLSGGLALAQAPPAAGQSQNLSGTRAALEADNPTGGLPALPPLPPASASTIFGGAIRRVDPVLDQILLDVYGQHPMKILFDERTQVFRDGVKIPLHDLKPVEHASVQTALDGSGIFAISIHILSQAPKGDFRGRVLRYNSGSGLLQLNAAPSPPFTVVVGNNTAFVRKGQSAFTAEPSGRWDLKPGALVTVTFAPGGNGHAVASSIEVLAVPGASFIFSGKVVSLDMATGWMTIEDPRDNKDYQLYFYSHQILDSQDLRVGKQVRVTADYDGSTYIARDIQVY